MFFLEACFGFLSFVERPSHFAPTALARVLRKLAVSRPLTFRGVVDKPKAKKGSGFKRNKIARETDKENG